MGKMRTETLTTRTFCSTAGNAKTIEFREFVITMFTILQQIAKMRHLERGGYVVMLMLEDNDSADELSTLYPGKTESVIVEKERATFLFVYGTGMEGESSHVF